MKEGGRGWLLASTIGLTSDRLLAEEELVPSLEVVGCDSESGSSSESESKMSLTDFIFCSDPVELRSLVC